MSLKLKLSTSKAPEGSVPPTPSSAHAGTTPGSGGGVKLKLNASQPPTPATETPASAALPPPATKKPKQAASTPRNAKGKGGGGGGNKKRAANDDISPAPKRPNKGAAPKRNISISIKASGAAQAKAANDAPSSAAGSSKILLRRKSTQPKLRTLMVKRPPPTRQPGQGYDSEDSEAEEDPAVHQAFILRMEPGEDCDYLRDAIANGKIGLPPNENGAEVSLRFIEKDYRRAVVTVRGRKYAAALVDLPCIVETMKSWDKKGWWKVADISQMLLVLARCNTDEEARSYPLPREVDKNTLQYPHGLTPPMHWVRKRRFRKRLSYKTIANVEEEVERLLREDEQVESMGGQVMLDIVSRAELERSQDPEQSQEDEEEGDAIETVENGQEYEEYYSDEGDAEDLEGNLQAMFDEDHANADVPMAEDLVSESPAPIADQAASFAAVENTMMTSDSPAAETPADQPETTTQDEQSSDEDESDEDEDEDSPDVMDEDAVARAAERNQQLEEVADLEREVEAQKRKMENTKNQLLKERALAQLRTLEEDLRVKRTAVFGVDGEGEGDGED